MDQEGRARRPASRAVPESAAGGRGAGRASTIRPSPADVARAVGRELRAAGFTWNLAPVLDVHTNPENPIIGDRAFSHDPDRVARMGLAAFTGLRRCRHPDDGKALSGARRDGGRFPPHPAGEPTDRRPGGATVEFLPFREGDPGRHPEHPGRRTSTARPSIPSAPAACPGSSSRRSCAGELGFDGVVVSDDLEMRAIVARFDIGEAAVRFLEAGGDLILICRDADRQREAIAAVESAAPSWTSPRTSPAGPRSTGSPASPSSRISPDRPALERRTARAVVGAQEHRALLATGRHGSGAARQARPLPRTAVAPRTVYIIPSRTDRNVPENDGHSGPAPSATQSGVEDSRGGDDKASSAVETIGTAQRVK